MPFFHPSGPKKGQPIFARHEYNNRVQLATRRFYKKLVLKHGVTWADRAGDIVVVPDHLRQDEWTLHVLSGATLLEACYEAIRDDPRNDQVIELLRGQVCRL